MSYINRDLYDKARRDLDLTHQQVADLVGVNRVSLMRWLSGSADPKISNLHKLAQVLDLNWKDLAL